MKIDLLPVHYHILAVIYMHSFRIKNGSRVPADARIIACPQLKLEASSITGESEPVEYQTEEVREGTSLFDGRNVAFNGALCVDGEGIGVVIRVRSFESNNLTLEKF